MREFRNALVDTSFRSPAIGRATRGKRTFGVTIGVQKVFAGTKGLPANIPPPYSPPHGHQHQRPLRRRRVRRSAGRSGCDQLPGKLLEGTKWGAGRPSWAQGAARTPGAGCGRYTNRTAQLQIDPPRLTPGSVAP